MLPCILDKQLNLHGAVDEDSARLDGKCGLRALHGPDAGCRFSVFMLGMLVSFVMLVSPAQAATANNQNARTELVKMLAAMGKLKSIQSPFVCEKQLQILRKPFFSHGIITIARPRQVRFETIWPYQSCYILNGQSIYMRNESDSHWHTGTVNSQPAIGIIMRQFAAWSLGNAEKVSAEYQISMKRAVRIMPHIPHAPGNAPVHAHGPHTVKLSLFTLRPRRGVLKQAIQEIQLGFAPLANVDKPTDHVHRYHLTFIRIVSKNGDQSLFWLRHTKANLRLNSHCFAPVGPA